MNETENFQASIPEAGEDFQVISNDYQKLIVPGAFNCNYIPW
jgi:hypothetical protein